MVLSECEKLYPICDTDMWVKVSRYKKTEGIELILNTYQAVFISDAVVRELFRNDREKDVDDFKCGQDNFNEEKRNSRVYTMRLSNTDMFDEETKNYVLRLFINNKIYYDESENKFIGTIGNVGEKVTIIYAFVHDLKVILSDDSHSKTFIDSKFPDFNSNVMNIIDILRLNGYIGDELVEIRNKINESFREAAARTETLSEKLSAYRKKNSFKM